MERLTRRSDTGHAYYPRCFEEPCGGDGCKIKDCLLDDIICDRLAAYEDTGLEPAEVHSMYGEWSAMMSVLNSIGGGYDRLRELAEADKDGRLVVLPCKVGDTVYEVTSRKTISEYRVKAIRVELFCTFIEWDIVAGFVDKSIFGVPVNELGKTVFLTREEAEKALEAMKDA